MAREFAIIEAPSNLGLRPPGPGREPGTRRLPEALRRAGFHAAVGESPRRVEAPSYVYEHDGSGVRNGRAIAAYSARLADAVEASRSEGQYPVVLGGDCSIMLGCLLGVRRVSPVGLVFLDAHLDFRHPGNAPETGAVAGEDLALATGRGTHVLSRLEGYGHLVADERVVAMGQRDLDGADDIVATQIRRISARELRELVESHARAAATLASRAPVQGFWTHVDADVLDPSVLAAVDSPSPGGLDESDLTRTLRVLLRHPRSLGVDLTIYDPDMDPKEEGARILSRTLLSALGLEGP